MGERILCYRTIIFEWDLSEWPLLATDNENESLLFGGGGAPRSLFRISVLKKRGCFIYVR